MSTIERCGDSAGYRIDITRITNQVDAILAKWRCVEFAKRILNPVSIRFKVLAPAPQ